MIAFVYTAQVLGRVGKFGLKIESYQGCLTMDRVYLNHHSESFNI
jgi:hypothetical protein